jgi:hypothetical protein
MKIYKNLLVPHLLDSPLLSSCQNNTKHFQESELEELSNFFETVSADVLHDIGSTNEKIKAKDSWINFYNVGSTNEMHTHSDPAFLARGDHIGIQVLEVGSVPENITFVENNVEIDVPVVAGDFIVIDHTVLHGLKPVKEKLRALMITIKR